MARFEFHLPDIGEGLAEVELVRWLVKLGDSIEENQPIADVESDKAVVTMPAPASGRVIEFSVSEGERLKVGGVMLVMDTADGNVTTEAMPPSAAPVHAPAAVPVAASPVSAASAPVMAAPAARKRAKELGVDLDVVRGTGPGGRITIDDVERHGTATTVTATAAVGAIELVPFKGIRRRIAEAMERSARAIPHVTGFHEFDAEALVALHASLKPRAEPHGIRLTYLPFIVKAVARALQAHPVLNASLDEAAGVIQLKKFYNVGIAAATPEGLMVPVVHGVDGRHLIDLAREIDRLVAGARDGRLAPADLQHGTFTITNVGAARGWLNTSLIRQPEVAILGIGRVEERAVVRQGQVVPRPVMPLALTFDHRVIDGDQGLGFMLTLREWLEHPSRLLDDEPAW